MPEHPVEFWVFNNYSHKFFLLIEEYLLTTKDYLGASGRLSIDEKGNVIKGFEIVEVLE